MKFEFNFYTILGVENNVDNSELKKVYRSLSKKYHPDNLDTGDEEIFKKIAIAYDILSDPVKRKLYDLGKWDDLEPESKINLTEAEQNVIALFQNSINSNIASIALGSKAINYIVENIRDNISREIDNYERELGDLKSAIIKLNGMLPKIKFTSDNTKFNLYKMAMVQVVSLKEGEIEDIKVQLEMAKEMYGILQDFYFQDSKDLKTFTEKLLGI